LPVGSVEAGSVGRPGTVVKTARGVVACSVASRFGSGLGALDGKLQASINMMSTIQNRGRLYISRDYNQGAVPSRLTGIVFYPQSLPQTNSRPHRPAGTSPKCDMKTLYVTPNLTVAFGTKRAGGGRFSKGFHIDVTGENK